MIDETKTADDAKTTVGPEAAPRKRVRRSNGKAGAPAEDGKVTADGFSFAATVEFGGTQVEMHVKGTVAGNQVSGTMDSPQGTVSFTGKRNP